MATTLKALCRSRGRKYGHFVVEFATPGIGHILKGAGCDFVLFDTEHSGFGFETIKSAVRYFEAAQLPAIVRVPSKAYDQIARAADMGAEAVMVPMVDTAEEAAELASSLKYTPLGRRGVALGIAHDDYRAGPVTEKLAGVNERTCLFVQIETASGVEHVEKIAAVPGVDCLWVGHFDLSASLGIPGQFEHPEFLSAIDRVAAACARARQGLRPPRPGRRHRNRVLGARVRLPVLVGRRLGASGGGQRRHRRDARGHRGRAAAEQPLREGLTVTQFRVALSGDFRKAGRIAGLPDVRPLAAPPEPDIEVGYVDPVDGVMRAADLRFRRAHPADAPLR